MAATCNGRAKRRLRGAANCRSSAESPNLAMLKAEYFRSIKMQQKRCSSNVTEVRSGKWVGGGWESQLGVQKQGFSEMTELPKGPY
jgi:hypothetical protein